LDDITPKLTGINVRVEVGDGEYKYFKQYDWLNEDKPIRVFKMKADLDALLEDMKKVAMKKDLGEKIDKKYRMYERVLDKIKGKDKAQLQKWFIEMKYRQDAMKTLKNFKQMKISELYRDTDKEYRHKMSEMNLIDNLIVDIDKNLSFNEFKELYKDWEWIAYPSINNTDPTNWNKFRVIVPLDHTVDLGFDRNIEILQALRSQFCVYEDRKHALPSYINREDWSVRYENEGYRYCIEQSEVEEMRMLIIAGNDRTTKAWEENIVNLNLTTDEVKEKYIQSAVKKINDCKDGERDNTIYGQFRFLAEKIKITSADANKVIAGITDPDKKRMAEEIIRRHGEWNL
jgi:hypothetical protein